MAKVFLKFIEIRLDKHGIIMIDCDESKGSDRTFFWILRKMVKEMKILHTADLHLDRAFEGLGKIPAGLSEKLSKTNQRVMQRIVDTALSEKVDVVLVVGDTFHQARMSIQVQSFFVRQLQRLEKAEIPVVLVFGNHDFVQPNRLWFALPDNVIVLEKERVETVTFVTKNHEKVAVSGFSYHHPHLSKNLLLEFPVRYPEVDYHIGLYHGEISRKDQGKFAPFKLSEMKEKQYDYWALGHIHKPEVLHQEHPVIAYAGSPQGHTRKEKDSNGVLITELSKQGEHAKQVRCAEVEWHVLEIAVPSHLELSNLLPMIEQQIFRQSFIQDGRTHLLQIQLLDVSPSVEMELEEKMKNNEFLYHLQEMIYQKTDGSVWIFDIRWQSEADAFVLPFALNRELMDQLASKYREEDSFSEILAPLLQQKDLSRELQFDAEQRSEIVQHALQGLLQTMGIQREDR